MNNVQIMATITRDIELRYTNNNTAIASFGIAYNEKWSENGEKKEKAHFFDVTAFGKTAENINTYFRKGQRILISGSLSFEQWEDKQNGQKRSKVSIKLKEFDFIEKADNSNQQPQQQYQQPQNQAQGIQQHQQQNPNVYQPQQQQYVPPQQPQVVHEDIHPNQGQMNLDDDGIPF